MVPLLPLLSIRRFMYVLLLTHWPFEGNQTNENWNRSQTDLQGALSNGNLLVQARMYPSWDTTNDTTLGGLVNVTATLDSPIRLPYDHPDGTPVYLGEDDLGFPSALYPNLTYGPKQHGRASNLRRVQRKTP